MGLALQMIVMGWITVLGCAAPPVAASAPAAQAPTTQPAEAKTAEELLERLEKKSAGFAAVKSKIVYSSIEGMLGDKQVFEGELTFAAGPPARYAARIDKQTINKNRVVPKNRWYIFDGKWMVEKIDEPGSPKTFKKEQVVPPDAKPEDADPLALGKGPFPVPLNMNKKTILERYDVTLEAPDAKEDPQGNPTYHLKLVPKAGTDVNFTDADLWYSKDTLLPRRGRTYNKDSEKKQIADLADHQVTEKGSDTKLDEKVFDTTRPKESGWDITITPWRGDGK